MRHMPLGCDRNHDRYWFFPAAAAGLYVEKGLFYILMSHLLADKLISVNCRQCTIRQLVSTSLGNSGLYWTVFTWNRDTAVPAEGNGNLQTLICVLVARSRRCTTLSNSVPWQNWMAAYLGCSLQMKMLFRGWPIMVHDAHTRRRNALIWLIRFWKTSNLWTVTLWQ